MDKVEGEPLGIENDIQKSCKSTAGPVYGYTV